MDLFEAIKGRRSVRAFTAQPVPDELLNRILETACWAPSAGNCQARDFIVVDDPEVKRLLCLAALDQESIEEAPVNIVVCANQRRSARRYGDRGRRFYSVLDAAAAVENILLAVHASGLGACWIGAYNDERVAEILNLPIWLKPVAIIPVGYPSEMRWPTSRFPLDSVIYRNRYEEKKGFLPQF